jgi:hypothetical protein
MYSGLNVILLQKWLAVCHHSSVTVFSVLAVYWIMDSRYVCHTHCDFLYVRIGLQIRLTHLQRYDLRRSGAVIMKTRVFWNVMP